MCRAYLSDFVDKSSGEHIFTSRANIGACALNLPMIWKKSEGVDFYKDLDYYLEMIRQFLIKRYDYVANQPCSTNPLAFTQGGLYRGVKKETDKIGYDIVESFTASFGFTALNELNVLMTGKPLHESDRREVNKVIQTGGATLTGEDLPLYKVPLVGRFVGDTEGQSGQSQKFYEGIRQLNMLETERNGLVNSGRGQEAAEFAKENPGVRMILMGNRAEKEVRDLRTQKRNLMKRNATSDEIKRIDERITERMRRFNEQAASVI